MESRRGHVPSHVASTPQARATTAELDALPPRHRRMPEARQHVSSVGYLSTLMTTSTHANPTNSTDASRFEEGGAGGFGAASKASGLGHVPFVPLSGGARAKYSTYGCWSRAEPIVALGSTSSRGNVGAGGRSCAMLCSARRLCSALFASTSCVSFALRKKLRAHSVPANGSLHDK